MPLITTTITPFTHTPSRQNPATFSEDMDYRLSEENSRITQMNNLGTQMNSVADLVNTIETNLNLVANDLTNIDTVATNITKVNTVSTNITKVSNLDTNMTKITNLDTNMTKIANVDNNMSKVSNLDTNMTKIANVDTNINDIVSVADNEANINTVAENIGSITSKIGTADIHNSTSKTTPSDSDEMALLDSTSSFSLKKLTWANLKATLGTIFAPLTNPTFTGDVSVDDLNVLSGFNLNQTWQDVTSSRVAGATYWNTTGKPIIVSVYISDTTLALSGFYLMVDGNTVSFIEDSGTNTKRYTVTGVVPYLSSYKASSSQAISSWLELR